MSRTIILDCSIISINQSINLPTTTKTENKLSATESELEITINDMYQLKPKN